MGQKVNPVAFRTGVMVGWKSKWFASKRDFPGLLLEDKKIRDFILKHPDQRIRQKYRNAGIDKVEIERTRDEVRVTLFVARPGLIIGQKGQEVEKLQEELQNLVGRRINLKIEEVGRPELRAQLVAEDIADQLAKRASFRRTMKRAIESTMEAGARGIKIQMAGRLGGAEMARREKQIEGSIPLSTLRAKIDYGFTEARTPQGHIGVQVWINNGFYEGDDSDGYDASTSEAPKKPKKTYKR
ncbi:30S ribosomal protein S3 [Blastopirellula marina]|uniref:Small ribosomal subunit protein uS3 n=2 Tax=Pirellulaceae TaxID=2691357 RepID=A0A2S8FU02_9BACT|nr:MULTISPECIES: 30S ribosomal protein S3 [Pirellulaceae]PQO35652.1 30S ribosomal protein S3 [Blastopirellula marina]QDU77740.1 30S ribosomal protein S3 [Bremerella volcania]RCS53226.1 30S ribosomal protein S3 [Bremerella cremea]WDI45070.1 30S ribosomal protein S3 [Bremerella sp. P1]